MKRLIACIAILLMVSLASGTAVSVTIYGTNKSNAQTNVTCYGCNNTISVQAWNTSYVKNISVNSINASGDVISFNISNVTAYRVQELKVNGTAINAYQAGANGMLNFSYNVSGNRTLVLSPAVNVNGYNSTWGYFWNLIGFGNVGIGTMDTAYGKITVFEDLAGSSTGPQILLLRDPPSATDNYGSAITHRHTGTDDALMFKVGSGVDFRDDSATRMTLLRTGNIGINTTTPRTILDVNGVITGNGSGLSSLNASNLTGLSTSGTYTGDSTANRAISHGLGKIPTKILIQNTGQGYGFMLDYRHGSVVNMGTGIQTVTAMDITNFYVGNAGSYINSANLDTNVYNWMAVS